jgi:hypothetical protein
LYHHQIPVYPLPVHLQEQEVDLVVEAVLAVVEVQEVDSLLETS